MFHGVLAPLKGACIGDAERKDDTGIENEGQMIAEMSLSLALFSPKRWLESWPAKASQTGNGAVCG